MKKPILSFILILFIVVTKAQTTSPPNVPELDKLDSTNQINTSKFTSVEQQPEFPGGMDHFYVILLITYVIQRKPEKITLKEKYWFLL